MGKSHIYWVSLINLFITGTSSHYQNKKRKVGYLLQFLHKQQGG